MAGHAQTLHANFGKLLLVFHLEQNISVKEQIYYKRKESLAQSAHTEDHNDG